jgi:hypothetical protein
LLALAFKRTPLFNGVLECRLFEYKMVAGNEKKNLKRDSNLAGRKDRRKSERSRWSSHIFSPAPCH